MIEFLFELGLYGANYKAPRGALWRCSFYDAANDRRPAGSADSPWEALAWALVSYEEGRRGILVIARDSRDTPEVVLARLKAAA